MGSTASHHAENQKKAKELGLKYYKDFSNKRFHINQFYDSSKNYNAKATAKAQAKNVREEGRNARVVKRTIKYPGEKKKTTYIVYASGTQVYRKRKR